MNKFKNNSRVLTWVMALLLSALAAGCGGGSGGQDPILGTGGAGLTAVAIPLGAVIPGPATCAAAVANPLIPAVTSSSPTNGALNVTTSTTGVAGGGKLITATFSLAMNAATITAPGTFTVTGTGGIPVTGTVTFDAPSRTATFTTAAALPANTLFTAIITTAAQSTTGTAIACSYAWTFTTGAVATGQATVNLGTAGTYGIFASADAAVTLAGVAKVNGDVGLMNGLGPCNGCAVPATVSGAIHNGDAAAIQAQIDFRAAYVDAANRSTNACPIVNAELASAQAACGGVTPGPTYGPGLYRTANPLLLGVGMTMTLDAGGNPDAVFIFQSDAAITTGTSSTVVLANGAQAKNVFWMAGSAATLGVSSIFKGTVIANGAAVSVLGGTALLPTLVEGRLFSSAAAATVGTFATVTVPAP